MFEYTSVSASAYDTQGLVGKLNEQAADGWDVVSVVTTGGGDVTAFLKREAKEDSMSSVEAAGDVDAAAAAGTFGAAVTEPSGWSTEPSPEPEPPTDVIPPEAVAASDTSFIEASEAPAASVSTTPAGWYPDPSGRYEMRYWDGDKWTEHVSRQGQTYTDPPVA